jgi:ribose transport system permease protein
MGIREALVRIVMMHAGVNETASELPASRVRATLLQLAGARAPLFGLLVLCMFLALSTDTFMTFRNMLNVMDQVTVLGILAVGMTLVILIGGIDLSVGSVLAWSVMAMAYTSDAWGLPFGLCILIAVATSALFGVFSGLLITVAGLPPFIATLATMSIARGFASLITDGQQIVGFPGWFTDLAIVRHFGAISITVAAMITLMAATGSWLNFRAEGRLLFAIGGNAEVARLAGIRVKAVTVAVYSFCSALAGLAGIVLAARLDSAQPSAGLGYELNTIAAVIIGGASLNGGIGGMGGTAIGVLIISFLNNGLNLLRVSPFVQQVIIGAVIALAVATDTWRRRKR